MNEKNKEKPKIMFAVVSEDIVGQTIELFRNKKQAEEFLEAMKQKE